MKKDETVYVALEMINMYTGEISDIKTGNLDKETVDRYYDWYILKKHKR